jgi:DNA-binding response OmpR family regulator
MGERKEHILCIDDDQDTCNMMTFLLLMQGYEGSYALTYEDGLELASCGGFDLILLDLYFPDGNGIEFCKQIRRFDQKTPIIFCSGEAREAERRKAIEAGGQDFLVKPVDYTKLLSSLSGLKRERRRQEKAVNGSADRDIHTRI